MRWRQGIKRGSMKQGSSVGKNLILLRLGTELGEHKYHITQTRGTRKPITPLGRGYQFKIVLNMPVFFPDYSKPSFVWHFSKGNPEPDVLWARADKPINVHVPVKVGGYWISFALTMKWATFIKSCLYIKQWINVYKHVFKYKTGWKDLVGKEREKRKTRHKFSE